MQASWEAGGKVCANLTVEELVLSPLPSPKTTQFCVEKTLYSYFIGLDYNYNRRYSLYNRILYDSISNAIEKKVSKIVYGRTAAEFKSTIGAIPLESKSVIYIDNKVLRFMLYAIIKYLSPKKWRQRNPFKNKEWKILK